MRITADYHTHTVFSHGTGTPEENVKAAIARGLSCVAISEHAPAHLFFGVRGERLAALRREVDRLAALYAGQIRVLMGMECNLTGFGKCDFPPDLDRGLFDVVLLAFHKGVAPTPGFIARRTLESLHLGKGEPERTADALLAAAEKYRIDMFSHPGLYVACDIERLARGAKELGVLLEINGARVTMSREQLQCAANAGARFVINSDAHSPARVGEVEKAVAAAQDAGVASLVFNLAQD